MSKNISWNWFHALALANLFCFGLFGGFTTQQNPVVQIFLTIYFLALGLLSLQLAHQPAGWTEKSQTTHRDFWVFVGTFVALMPLSWEYLSLPLQKDQIAHAQQSSIHGLMVLRFLYDQGWLPKEWTYSTTYHFVGLVALVALGILYWVFVRLKSKSQLLFYAIVFLLLRAAVFVGGGNPDPHPPLRLLFPTVMSWVGGLSSSLFRLSSYAFLCFVSVMVFRWARKSMSSRKAFIFALASVGLPVIWHAGVVVEVSIIVTLGFTLLILSLLQFSWREFPLERWLALTAIFSLARMPFVVAYVPLAIIAVKKYRLGFLKFDRKTVLSIGLSLGLSTPYLILALTSGIGSKFSANEANPLTSDPSALNRVLYALNEGIISQSLVDHFFGLWWVLAIPIVIGLGAIIRRVRRRWGRDCAWIVLVLVPLMIYLYFSVKPKYWGLARYYAEFAAPFYIAGLFSLLQWLRRWPFGHWLALGIVAYNFWTFSELPGLNPRSDDRISMATELGTRALSETVYDYKAALAQLKEEGFAGRHYIVGTTYGTFLEVLSGFTFEEVHRSQGILRELYSEERKWVANFRDPVEADRIHNNSNVELVLFSDLPRPEIEQGLLARDWVPWQVFLNPRFGSTLRGYRRQTLE